jgi:hypothetical protein
MNRATECDTEKFQLPSSVAGSRGLPLGYKYWAFVSYSHRDEQWAKWIHEGIETYKVLSR